MSAFFGVGVGIEVVGEVLEENAIIIYLANVHLGFVYFGLVDGSVGKDVGKRSTW